MYRTAFMTTAILHCLLLSSECTEITLGAPFGNHMLLQRDRELPIWGKSLPNSEISVSFGGQNKKSLSDDSGNWCVNLDPMPAESTGRSMLVMGSGKTIELTDVLVGELWLASGQSNMVWTVAKSDEADSALAGANIPGIRFMTVTRHIPRGYEFPDRLKTEWKISSRENAGNFSAVAFHFAKILHEAMKVPVGMIVCAAGGTWAELWTPPEELAELPFVREQLARHYDLYEDASVPFEKKPVMPGALFQGYIKVLLPLSLRGVLWYQGESNLRPRYSELLSALVSGWRREFGNENLPFLIVQLPNYGGQEGLREELPALPNLDKAVPQNRIPDWPALRDAQFEVSSCLSNCPIVCTVDSSKKGEIHPPEKKVVGKRLAYEALASVYDREILSSGPRFERAIFENDKVRVFFSHTGTGLVGKNTAARPLWGFQIAGSDGKFFNAEAEISGKEEVMIWNKNVKTPEAVRYAWENYPYCDLSNSESLPAFPFSNLKGK